MKRMPKVRYAVIQSIFMVANECTVCWLLAYPPEEEMFLAVEHQAVEQFSIAFGVDVYKRQELNLLRVHR